MATPLAMAVAAGRAARAGIFIKSDEATQQLTAVDTVILDKTGTLTEGRMTLVESVGDDAALTLAAALEAHSNHPIAAALLQARGCAYGNTSPPLVQAFEAVAMPLSSLVVVLASITQRSFAPSAPARAAHPQPTTP